MNEEFSIEKYINFLKRNKYLITIITLTGTVISIASTYIVKPVWRGSFEIVVRDSSGQSNSRLSNLSQMVLVI